MDVPASSSTNGRKAKGDPVEFVPFNPQWADSGNKLDLKAIYRSGDRIVSLPVRRHNDWSRKGFTYVTLASAEDVIAIKPSTGGLDWNKVALSYDRNGHFKMQDYLAEQPQREADEAAMLKARLAQLDSNKKAQAK